MYGVVVWTIAVILSAGLLLMLAWALKPALLGAWTWIVTPRESERLRELGVVGMKRGLVAIPCVLAFTVLVRVTLGPPLDRIAIVNYAMAVVIALTVGMIYLIATRGSRQRGG